MIIIVYGLYSSKDAFWTDLQVATGGSYLRYCIRVCQLFEDDVFFLSRLPNAEHSCAGHEISLFFSMRSFYLSLYDVSRSKFYP